MSALFSFMIRPILLIGAACLLAGCASGNATELRMVSLDHRRVLSQQFNHAYFSHDSAGDADVILVAHPAEVSASARNAGPQMPRQLVHIRIFWIPRIGARADHPAATNASVNWCLLAGDDSKTAVQAYGGSALVELHPSSSGESITIERGWMKPTCQCGDLRDPLGPAILTGSIYAVDDPRAVTQLLAELRGAIGPLLASARKDRSPSSADMAGSAASGDVPAHSDSDASAPKPLSVNP